MFGQVSDKNGDPIFMIKVSVYEGDRLIAKAYTGDDGRYSVDAEASGPVCVLFDTHPTLNAAEKWHPSIVSNVMAKADGKLDRILASTESQPDDASALDALSAYMFALLWSEHGSEGYKPAAAKRLSTIKFSNESFWGARLN
jgi:hypothetical protein